MGRRSALAVACFAALGAAALPSIANAQVVYPQPPAATTPAPAPPQPAAPSPAPAKLQLGVKRLVRSKGRTLAPLGSRVRVRAVLAPYAPNQVVAIQVYRNGRQVLTRQLKVQAVPGKSMGRAAFGFQANAIGRYEVRATHPASDLLAAAVATPRRFSVRYPSVSPGERSSGARLLQSLLARRGYAVPHSGVFDAGTGRAVLAFRKVNGMRRTATAGRRVFSKLARGGGFRLRYPKSGKHVEVDLSRQVMVLASGGRVARTYHVSTGSPATPTIRGVFRFYSHTPGYNAKGMYYSVYFIRGYANHGYASVPVYPASHGCVRTPIANAQSIYRWIRNGDRIYVYY